MNNLVIKITGEIVESNFDVYHLAVLKTIKDADKQLVTDADFVEASGIVKTCKTAETAIKDAKQVAVSQTIDIEKLFTKMDEVSEAVRATRLSLEKKIKTEQESRKNDIINTGIKTVETVIEEKANKFPQIKSAHLLNRQHFLLAVKGKKTIATVQTAINEKVKQEITTINATVLRISSNLSQIEKAEEEFPCLFPEKDIICFDSIEIIKNLITARVANFKLKQLEAENKKKADLEVAKQKEVEQEESKKNKKKADLEVAKQKEVEQEESKKNKTEDPIPSSPPCAVSQKQSNPSVSLVQKKQSEIVKQEIKEYFLLIEIKATKEKAVQIAQQINDLLSAVDVVKSIKLNRK